MKAAGRKKERAGAATEKSLLTRNTQLWGSLEARARLAAVVYTPVSTGT